MNKTKRHSVGYCTNVKCDEFHKGVFLTGIHKQYYCMACRILGMVKKEEATIIGNSRYFSEIRIEYNFDGVEFRELFVLRDENSSGGSTFMLKSPFIRTDKRADRVANVLLSHLNMLDRRIEDGEIPMCTEITLDISSPTFDIDLARVADLWQNINRNRELES